MTYPASQYQFARRRRTRCPSRRAMSHGASWQGAQCVLARRSWNYHLSIAIGGQAQRHLAKPVFLVTFGCCVQGTCPLLIAALCLASLPLLVPQSRLSDPGYDERFRGWILDKVRGQELVDTALLAASIAGSWVRLAAPSRAARRGPWKLRLHAESRAANARTGAHYAMATC